MKFDNFGTVTLDGSPEYKQAMKNLTEYMLKLFSTKGQFLEWVDLMSNVIDALDKDSFKEGWDKCSNHFEILLNKADNETTH